MKIMMALCAITFISFTGYQYLSKGYIMEEQQHLSVYIGESFKDFTHRNPVKTPYKKPSGSDIIFHEYQYSSNSPASVTLHSINNKAILDNVTYMMVTEDLRDHTGVGNIYLQAGITPDSWMSHTEARMTFHAFLQTLLASGWQYAQSYEEPRLAGQQSMRYKLNEDRYYYLDPAYLPTLKEWRTLKQGDTAINYWYLHTDNQVFMSIQLGFEDHETDPEIGSYLLFIEVLNGELEARRYFSPDTAHRMNQRDWKLHWQERLEMAAKARAESEAVAIKNGYIIDKAYEDYVINPADY